MKTIYKYNLSVDDKQVLYVPEKRRPLCIQLQNGKPCLWVEVDNNSRTVPMSLITRGTGHPLPDKLGLYIGTYQIPGLVFHVYEEGE